MFWAAIVFLSFFVILFPYSHIFWGFGAAFHFYLLSSQLSNHSKHILKTTAYI